VVGLADVQQHDADGNVQRGDVYLDGVSNSLVRAESRIVAVVGVKDLVVVETAGRRAGGAQGPGPARQEGGRPPEGQGAHRAPAPHPRVPSVGHYEGIDAGERFQVKRITVKPGEKLSLQMHHHRAEHWVVVSGTARVTCGDKVTCWRKTSRPISRSA
jgi:mannose-1-phosphate guanylyltransferase/mannose-6-phosphate isomerase